MEIINSKNLTEDFKYKIKKWKEFVDKGHYGSSSDIVDTYNSVFMGIKQPIPYTSCGSCLRKYCIQMYNALEEYEKSQEKAAEILETIDEFMTEEEVEKPKKKVGRPRKNE